MADATNNVSQALDWDSDLEVSDYILLDEGYYPFVVKDLAKEYFDGSEKIAPCPRAHLTLICDYGEQEATVHDRILLSASVAWRSSNLFEALGFQKDASTGKMKPHWNEVVGRGGYVKIGVRTYTNKNGEEKQANEVLEYVKPAGHAKAEQAYNEQIGKTQSSSGYNI